jgi:thiamine pyrophosphokinase
VILVDSPEPVTLVGAGPIPPGALARALALAPLAVAADGGGDVALPGGRAFAAVIGDMDSLSDPEGLRAAGTRLHEIAEQDSTDLEKCLYSVAAPLTLGVGFLGGRADHHLAAMSALVRAAPRPVILLGSDDICFACPTEFALELTEGARVSFYPMRPVAGLCCEGLRWSVAGLDFAPDQRIGTSNVALGGAMRVAFNGPGMLAILPLDRLEAAAAALGRTA